MDAFKFWFGLLFVAPFSLFKMIPGQARGEYGGAPLSVGSAFVLIEFFVYGLLALLFGLLGISFLFYFTLFYAVVCGAGLLGIVIASIVQPRRER